MRRIALVALTLASLAGTAAADPFYGLFEYEQPRLPPGGDCAAIAAAIGPGATWYGEFSGKRYDDFKDSYHPVAARGCFGSEYACRVWQNEAITYLGRGPLVYTLCRQGVPG